MKHKEIKGQLIFYLEKSLTSEEIKLIEEHLDKCKECKYYLTRLKEDLAVLQEEKAGAADPHYYTRLKARIEAANRPVNRYRAWLQPAIFSLLLMIATTGGVILGRHFSPAHQVQAITSELLFFDGVKEEPIEQFLLTQE